MTIPALAWRTNQLGHLDPSMIVQENLGLILYADRDASYNMLLEGFAFLGTLLGELYTKRERIHTSHGPEKPETEYVTPAKGALDLSHPYIIDITPGERSTSLNGAGRTPNHLRLLSRYWRHKYRWQNEPTSLEETIPEKVGGWGYAFRAANGIWLYVNAHQPLAEQWQRELGHHTDVAEHLKAVHGLQARPDNEKYRSLMRVIKGESNEGPSTSLCYH